MQVNGRDVTGLHGDGLSPTEAIQTLLGAQGPLVVEIVRRHGNEDSSPLVTALSSMLSPPQTTLTSTMTPEDTARNDTERKDRGKTGIERDDCDDCEVNRTNNQV